MFAALILARARTFVWPASIDRICIRNGGTLESHALTHHAIELHDAHPSLRHDTT